LDQVYPKLEAYNTFEGADDGKNQRTYVGVMADEMSATYNKTSIAFDDVEIEPSTIKISLSQNFITLLSRQWYFINISNDPIHYAYGTIFPVSPIMKVAHGWWVI